MRITIKPDTDVSQNAHLPYEGADHVVGVGRCPLCKRINWRAQGVGPQDTGHDTVESACKCVECGEIVGRIRVRMSTIFGLEEDARVINGRCRVY
jgi:hypothetical protein